MIDLHCHILPELDDGAKTLSESIAMVRIAAASGTTDIVATPHANPQHGFVPELVDAKISELRRATDGIVQIYAGCDFHLSAANIADALANPAKYTINHGAHVLVEFSDVLIPPTAGEIFRRMRYAGMIPIITHPERNSRLRASLGQIKTWVEDGCFVQVTAQSYLGRFGRTARKAADELMRNGLVHFVASDAHDTVDRPPLLDEAYGYVKTRYGSACAESVFTTNPRAVLLGEQVEPQIELRNKHRRRWFLGNHSLRHFCA